MTGAPGHATRSPGRQRPDLDRSLYPARLGFALTPRRRSRAQLLGQKRQNPVEGDPGRMPRLVDEGDREHRVRRRRDTRRVARRRVDLDSIEGRPEPRPEGLESLRRATPVVGEPEPEHAQAVAGSFRDCREILSIHAEGGTATLPDGRRHDRLAHDGRDD